VIRAYNAAMKLIAAFFDRPADIVAKELLGSLLCVKNKDGTVVRLPVSEVEAYLGPHDLACHSAKGRTLRTETMFGPPGTIYIYLIYGMYYMFNIVTGKRDYPAAVLIRGAGTYDGPGKLTKALGIDMQVNGHILGPASGIWIEEPKYMSPAEEIECAPRIGVDYAGEWAERELRFILNR